MNSKVLSKIIDDHMKERGIEEYEIDGMSLSEGDFSVNEKGELESVGYIDVRIKPKCKIHEITINVKRE